MSKCTPYFVVLLSLCFVGMPTPSAGTPVDGETARLVAHNWLTERAPSGFDKENLRVHAMEVEGIEGILHVFNADPNGFILVAADDAVFPVLGYCFDQTFTGEDYPPQFDSMIENFKKQIIYAQQNELSPTAATQQEWRRLTAEADDFRRLGYGRDVLPLISTTWNQGYPWNALCPTDPSGPGGHVYAGCTAIAMAQVMKYWSYPIQGSGSHGYTHPDYGYLYADFGATTYDWSNMPNATATTATQQLLFHCGVSVEMDYGPSGSSGIWDMVYQLTTYFRYDATAHHEWKDYYTTATWESMIRSDLDAGRPLIYGGTGTGGHHFNLDGYQGTNHFHFNWGWSGAYNGYYYLTELNPGTHDYTDNQNAVLELEPLNGDDNDTPETATAITVPHTGDYAITPAGDDDWYRMYLSAGTTTIYTERINSSQLDPAAWFYGPNNANGSDVNPSSYIAYNDDGHGNLQPEITYAVTQSGYYFLRIAYYSDGPTGRAADEKEGERANTGDYRLVVVIADDAVGHWTFYEGSGTVLHDVSGNGNDGTITGATWVAGYDGSALRFDGVDDRVTTSLVPVYTNSQSFTWEAIAKYDAVPVGTGAMLGFENSDDGQVNIAQYGSSSAYPGYGYAFARSDNYASDGGSQLLLSTGVLQGTGWHHYALVRDRANLKYRLYVDYELQQEIDDNNSNSINAESSQPLGIGCQSHNTSWDYFFNGDIDEIRISNAALNTSQFLLFATQQPDMAATPNPLNITVMEGSSASATLTVQNTGNATLNVTSMSASWSWLTEDPMSFSVTPGNSQAVTVTANAAGLSAGTYNGTILISSNDPDENPYTVNVSVSVEEVTLTPPTNLTADLNQQTGAVELNWNYGGGGFYEDFEDGVADNFVFSDGRFTVADGYLKMNGYSNDTWASAYYDEGYQDFTLEYKFRRVQGNLGNSIGAFFRSDGFMGTASCNGYLVNVNPSGSYGVWIRVNGVSTNIIPWTTSSAINTGLNVDNVVTIQASGTTFSIYVNSIYVDSFTDGTFTGPGVINVCTYDATGYTHEVWWDNIGVTPGTMVLAETGNEVARAVNGPRVRGDITHCEAAPVTHALVPAVGLMASLKPEDRAFQHFQVYRGGSSIGTTTNTTYTDNLPSQGTYEYEVTAIYDEGESDPAGPVQVTWGTGIDLSVSLVGASLSLQWTPYLGAAAYWVYGADNVPFFVPGLTSPYVHRQAVLSSGTTSWSTALAVGDPDHNWTFLIVAVGASENELARSNRGGECDYFYDIP